MLEFIVRRSLRAFARKWSYDNRYAFDMLDRAGAGTVMRLRSMAKIGSYRGGVPARVFFSAKIAASLAADCGPCAQLAVSMAAAAGVDLAAVRAIVAGDREALGIGERLGFDLARATLARAEMTDVRAAVLARYGHRGLVELAYAIVGAQAFPTFKYAIGVAESCSHVHAGGERLARARAVAP